jgi:integrase
MRPGELLAHNVHPKYVQEIFGHASITLTFYTYSHVLPGMDGAAASAMEEALSRCWTFSRQK